MKFSKAVVTECVGYYWSGFESGREYFRSVEVVSSRVYWRLECEYLDAYPGPGYSLFDDRDATQGFVREESLYGNNTNFKTLVRPILGETRFYRHV